jgi:hypothetical protein
MLTANVVNEDPPTENNNPPRYMRTTDSELDPLAYKPSPDHGPSLPTTQRDHTVCGICDVSFYVCLKDNQRNGLFGLPQTVIVKPGQDFSKYTGTAYEDGTLTYDEYKNINDAQILVKKPAKEVKNAEDADNGDEDEKYGVAVVDYGSNPSVGWNRDEEHFLTHRTMMATEGTSCVASLHVSARYGIRKIKMCSHEDGPCAEKFNATRSGSAVGVPFHYQCLEIFRAVSLRAKGRYDWAALYMLGIQKNHAGFKGIKRDPALEINHRYNPAMRENVWAHVPGMEWVAADPFENIAFSIRPACYPTPLIDNEYSMMTEAFLEDREVCDVLTTDFRHRIKAEQPWAFEVFLSNGGIKHPPPGMSIDYEELYRLIQRTAGTGRGSFRGMRNRVRIWGNCVRILEIAEEMRKAGPGS